jgi:hypothetical protein
MRAKSDEQRRKSRSLRTSSQATKYLAMPEVNPVEGSDGYYRPSLELRKPPIKAHKAPEQGAARR